MNIGFPRTHAGENDSEPVKLEITVKPERNAKQKGAGQSDMTDDIQITEATAKIFYAHNKDDDKCRDKDDDKCREKDDDRCRDKDDKCRDKDDDKCRDKDDEKKVKKFICPEHLCKSDVFTVKSCDDFVCYDLGEYFIKQNGFILELSLKLKDVCPKRHTALAVILYELDECDKEYLRGFKTLLLPPTGKCVCDDICVECLHFVIPAALVMNKDCHPCEPRRFVAHYIANYVDSDFSICGCDDKH
jgi:hypothetical protein